MDEKLGWLGQKFEPRTLDRGVRNSLRFLRLRCMRKKQKTRTGFESHLQKAARIQLLP